MYEIKFSMFFIIFVIAKIVGERIMLEILLKTGAINFKMEKYTD